MIIGDTWQWTPFVFIVLLAALESLDQEVREAALVDGASRWQSFRHITLPAILPVTTTIVLIRIIEGFKIIDMPNILLGGGPGTATQSMTLQAYIDWNTLNLGRSAAIAYLLLILVTIVATVYVSFVAPPVTDRVGMTEPVPPPLRHRPVAAGQVRRVRPAAARWAVVVLFPIYWLFVTSFKTPYQVDKGPFYIPFVDFQPTLDAWHYILFDLGNDTIRPYINTVIVGLSSSVIALILGSLAAYALVRFTYRPAGRDHRPVHRLDRVRVRSRRARARRSPIAVASAPRRLR